MNQNASAPAAIDYWEWHNNILPILAFYGLPADSKTTLISFSENATWLVQCPRTAKKSVIRLSRPGYRSYEHITSELQWIAQIRRYVQGSNAGFNTPAVMRNLRGETITRYRDEADREQYAVMFEFVPGHQPQVASLEQAFYQLGSISALLHSNITGEPGDHFSRPDWNIDTAIGINGMWGCWRHNPAVGPETAALFSQAEIKLRKQINDYGADERVRGLIHGDLRLANLIVAEGAFYLIDFDDCGFSWYLYELACSLTLIEHHSQVERYVASWIKAYHRIRPLSARDIAVIPALVMLRRLLMVGWFATHEHSFEADVIALRERFVPDTAILARRYLADDYLTRLPALAWRHAG